MPISNYHFQSLITPLDPFINLHYFSSLSVHLNSHLGIKGVALLLQLSFLLRFVVLLEVVGDGFL